MSDYVRKKCIRFKIPQNIIDELENEEDWIVDLLLQKYKLKYEYETKKDNLTIGYGEDFDNNVTNYFLDYLLDYEYGTSGDFESVRLLTDNEFEKYSRKFAKYFSEIGRDELRLVHYSYYNGTNEPSVWKLEEI